MVDGQGRGPFEINPSPTMAALAGYKGAVTRAAADSTSSRVF
jgi:hypothetical protein